MEHGKYQLFLEIVYMTCNTIFTITRQQGRTRSIDYHPDTLLAATQLDLHLFCSSTAFLFCYWLCPFHRTDPDNVCAWLDCIIGECPFVMACCIWSTDPYNVCAWRAFYAFCLHLRTLLCCSCVHRL